MIKINCVENYKDINKNHFSSFIIEPLNIGNGITLGNTLRRTLLSEISNIFIDSIKLNNIKHEFEIIEGVREDTLEIVLNLKEIIFKKYNNVSYLNNYKIFLKEKGPKIITAGMFQLPQDSLIILNPEQYICNLINNNELFIEIILEINNNLNFFNKLDYPNLNQKINNIKINHFENPIKQVNYKIKLIHDELGNIKESLILEILTNGSISPQRALKESIKNILNLFMPLLVDNNLFKILENLK